MSLTVQQLLADAKRLSGRLREHDASADNVISNAQEVLKAVDAMRQYQEDIDNLNSIAHNRPRAQLVLGKDKKTVLLHASRVFPPTFVIGGSVTRNIMSQSVFDFRYPTRE